MSNVSSDGRPGSADPHPRLGTVALIAVIIGVVLLAVAAAVLSYAGIHQIALAAGVSAGLARGYPVIFDAMLVIAFAAALALRGAGWWTRVYVWFSLLLLLGAVAAADAVHAMGIKLPAKPSAAAVAIIPWALVLLGFGLWLAMLRYVRRVRSARAGGKGAGGWNPARPDRDSLVELRPAAAAPGLETRDAPGPLPQRTSQFSPAPSPPGQPGGQAGHGQGPGPAGPGPAGPGPAGPGPAGPDQSASVPARFDRMRSTPLAPAGEARRDEAPAADKPSAGNKPAPGDTASAEDKLVAGDIAPAGTKARAEVKPAAEDKAPAGNKPAGGDRAPAGHETGNGPFGLGPG
jgi:hypothetical protein